MEVTYLSSNKLLLDSSHGRLLPNMIAKSFSFLVASKRQLWRTPVFSYGYQNRPRGHLSQIAMPQPTRSRARHRAGRTRYLQLLLELFPVHLCMGIDPLQCLDHPFLPAGVTEVGSQQALLVDILAFQRYHNVKQHRLCSMALGPSEAHQNL
jgi:hypothetical protein